MISGVFTNSFDTVPKAKNEGADFATFSPVFATVSKAKYGEPQGLKKLKKVCEKLEPFPIIALGGIDETNYRTILENGARSFAEIRFMNGENLLGKLAAELRQQKKQMKTEQKNVPQICLTIAGLDPSGGAGIVADIKTFSAFGCFATSAVTSVTFQNTQGVFGAVHQTAESVRRQVEPIIDDFELSAVKTGMLPTREIIEETARLISKNNLKNIVIDPVVRSTSGFDLIDDEALQALIENLFPLADVVTPNLPEAERISKIKIKNETDIEKAAQIMQGFGAKNVLIKGGHFEGKRKKEKGNKEIRKAKDFLFISDKLQVFEAVYIETNATHGTGCTLASGIAANLALGNDLIESVKIAKDFVTEAIRTAPNIGKGNSPINFFKKARLNVNR